MQEILTLQQITKEINGEILFEIDAAAVQSGDKIGLIGDNGVGKSTLLKMIAGIDQDYKGRCKTTAITYYLQQLVDKDVAQSGGEQVRTRINQAFATDFDLLLLDEPTTNLDLENIRFLDNMLAHYQGTYIIVSHDRTFLEKNCNTIWELTENTLKIFPGKYSAYEHHLEQLRLEQKRAYENYLHEKEHLVAAIEKKKQHAATVLNKKSKLNDESAGFAKPYFAKKQKKVQKTAKAIERRLERLEEVTPVKAETKIVIKPMNSDTFKGRTLLQFQDFPLKQGNRLLTQPFTANIKGGEKIALVGANGSGKTTLLQQILRGKHQGMTLHPEVKLGYFSQTLDTIKTGEKILDAVLKSSIQPEFLVRTLLFQLGFNQYKLGQLTDTLSGGERVRLALIKLLVSDVTFMLLDEPTNYLDRKLLTVLEELLQNYQGTVLFVSHDQTFVNKVATKIWEIQNKKLILKNLDGTIEKTASQQQVILKKKATKHKKVEALMMLEIKLNDVIGRLSITSTPELEKEYTELIAQKKRLQD